MTRRAATTAHVLVGAAVAAVALLALLRMWQGDAYVDFSDGVYAATAREVLGGADLYGDVVAAQPPLLYLFGAGALAVVGESAEGLRWGVAVAGLAQVVAVTYAVRRLTGASIAAVVAGLASLLLPWTLREHAALVPEVLATPLLLGAAIAAARPRGAVLAGVLAALAVGLKVAFVLPAAAILLVAVARNRALAAATAAGAVLAAATLLGYGGAAWENIVVAQLESGGQSLRYVAELWVQAAWNEAPLVLLAALAWRMRSRSADPALMRTLAALAVGAALLVLTLLKDGSYLTVLVVLEAPLLVLAAAGLVWATREWAARERAPAGAGGGHVATGGGSRSPRGVLATGAVLAGLVAVQSVSLLASPFDAPLMRPPWSELQAGWMVPEDVLEGMVREAERCPPGVPYSGHPWVAFVAGRPMPGGQPDIFILDHPTHAEKAREAAADTPVCPAP